MLKLFLFSCICLGTASAQQPVFYRETYRPQFHFTPPVHWMNDPNGLIYLDGGYHLFYQYNPFGNKWGHMSWGHASSTNLLHWQHHPLAIPEEKDTMIFSGSCVYDMNNTSGFGRIGGKMNQPAMVAVYTGHIEGKNQSQHIAYSTDNGFTWTKYGGNPVLDLGKKDFRDPSVFWYEPGKKWIMSVVWPVEKQVHFYESANLKQWQHLSAFGPAGDTLGIWECPALFETPVAGQPGVKKWVLMLSPAPYMQYFVGHFNGRQFVNENPAAKIYRPDYGPDYYAAIPYNNLPAGQLPVTMGWVNNWNYANKIKTTPWSGALSLPRQLQLQQINGEWILMQQPHPALQQLRLPGKSWPRQNIYGLQPLPVSGHVMELECTITPSKKGGACGLWLAAGNNTYFEIGYDAAKQTVYIDRSKTGFSEQLNRYEAAVRPLPDGTVTLRIYFDNSIVEVFANNGQAALTAQVFPLASGNGVVLFARDYPAQFSNIQYWPIKSIW